MLVICPMLKMATGDHHAFTYLHVCYDAKKFHRFRIFYESFFAKSLRKVSLVI